MEHHLGKWNHDVSIVMYPQPKSLNNDSVQSENASLATQNHSAEKKKINKMTGNEVQQWQTRQDGLDNLFRGTAPMPSPGDGEVLVEIKAVSLNYRDTEGTESTCGVPLDDY